MYVINVTPRKDATKETNCQFEWQTIKMHTTFTLKVNNNNYVKKLSVFIFPIIFLACTIWMHPIINAKRFVNCLCKIVQEAIEKKIDKGEDVPKYLYVEPLPFSKTFTSNTTSFFFIKIRGGYKFKWCVYKVMRYHKQEYVRCKRNIKGVTSMIRRRSKIVTKNYKYGEKIETLDKYS